MADDLRESLAQRLNEFTIDGEGFPIVPPKSVKLILDAILPLVEQAIREERDKGDADVRLAQKAAQRALAEQDAQISKQAALDRRTIEGLREWLAAMSPFHDLQVGEIEAKLAALEADATREQGERQ